MGVQIVEIEHPLKSKSARIIWQMLSTPEGLQKWIADEVSLRGHTLTFVWGQSYNSREERTATVLASREHDYVRFRWDDDDDDSLYWQLRMERSDLTGAYQLHITDFAVDDDPDTIRDIWEANLAALNRNTGL